MTDFKNRRRLAGCIFCGGLPLTKEHVLSNCVGRRIRTAMPNHRSNETDIGLDGRTFEEARRSGHPASRRVRCVCRPCNGGWMKRLVDDAQPLVLPLIRGDRCRLARADQETLAAWIAMAVIVSEFEDQRFVTIPPADRKWLYEHHTAPLSMKIWIGDYERLRWEAHWIHHRYNVLGPDADQSLDLTASDGTFNTQTTTYVIGRLYIHALSSAVAGGALDWRFKDADNRFLRRIWPAAPASYLWPPPTMADRDADRIASALMRHSLAYAGLPTLSADTGGSPSAGRNPRRPE